MGEWHLWAGSQRKGSCEVCGRKWPVLRYTNGEESIFVCLWHRRVIPGWAEQQAGRWWQAFLPGRREP